MADERVTVRFDANVNSSLPWRFRPEKRGVRLRLGEETLVHFTAANLSDQPITGTATFNVVPDKAAAYFNKLECFCFSEQTLAPGEEVAAGGLLRRSGAGRGRRRRECDKPHVVVYLFPRRGQGYRAKATGAGG